MGDCGTAGNNPDDSESRDVPLSTLFRSLAHRDRRAALRCLLDRPDEWIGLHELGIAVATARDAGPPADLTPVKADLRHGHLPTLADAGVIEYDPQKRIARYDGGERVETVLSLEELIDYE